MFCYKEGFDIIPIQMVQFLPKPNLAKHDEEFKEDVVSINGKHAMDKTQKTKKVARHLKLQDEVLVRGLGTELEHEDEPFYYNSFDEFKENDKESMLNRSLEFIRMRFKNRKEVIFSSGHI